MAVAKVLAFGADESLKRLFEEVVGSVPGCQLELVHSLAAISEHVRRGEARLLLAHLGDSAGADAFISFLEQTAAAGTPVPVVAVSESNDLELRLRLLRLKVVDCLPRPLDKSRLAFLVHVLTARPRLEQCPDATSAEARDESLSAQEALPLVGRLMNNVMKQLQSVAPLETTVLLTGETGSGKTHMARIIHDLSPRRNKPFVVAQCSTLTPTLIESELFGHVKGAFTGADGNRCGVFGEAEDGTILLDDVDCMPLDSQARLLRVVEDRLFEPVGSSRSQPLRARLIAATNRTLESEVHNGRFRSDLYFRLNVVKFSLPPLRQRRTEILPMLNRFLKRYCAMAERELLPLSGEASLALEIYDWPGNVRELRNVAERAVALAAGPVVEIDDLPDPIQACYRASTATHDASQSEPGNQLAVARKGGELQRLLDALHRNKNNRVRAAAELGVSRVTLYRKLHQYNLV